VPRGQRDGSFRPYSLGFLDRSRYLFNINNHKSFDVILCNVILCSQFMDVSAELVALVLLNLFLTSCFLFDIFYTLKMETVCAFESSVTYRTTRQIPESNKLAIVRSRTQTMEFNKLAITSPTSGGRSVGIVRSRTQTMEFSF
jgi:hypothetical protein